MQEHYIKNSTIRSEYETGYGPAEKSRGLGAEDPKSPHRAIPQAFANLEKDLYALGELVNVLNNRLKPISRPEGPENIQNEKGANAMISVPMVNAIAQADQMLCGCLHNLNGIIERLEI